MATRRTLRGWFEYLDRGDREYTLDELVAVMAMNSREYIRLQLEATLRIEESLAHIEGILGTFDETVAARDPVHAALGERRGAPIAATSGMLAARETRR